jgi:hypothetical protein
MLTHGIWGREYSILWGLERLERLFPEVLFLIMEWRMNNEDHQKTSHDLHMTWPQSFDAERSPKTEISPIIAPQIEHSTQVAAAGLVRMFVHAVIINLAAAIYDGVAEQRMGIELPWVGRYGR